MRFRFSADLRVESELHSDLTNILVMHGFAFTVTPPRMVIGREFIHPKKLLWVKLIDGDEPKTLEYLCGTIQNGKEFVYTDKAYSAAEWAWITAHPKDEACCLRRELYVRLVSRPAYMTDEIIEKMKDA